MGRNPQRAQYWRKTRNLTAVLCAVWVVVTYVVSWYARELNDIVVLGFPLGFYMGAQGTLLVYLLIVGVYCYAMLRLDRKYHIDEPGS